MKKATVWLITVVMFFTMTACQPTDISSKSSSSKPASEQTAGAIEWDMTKVSAPKAVDNFDVPVLVRIGDDTEIIPQKLYYDKEVLQSGYYEYKGTYNDRHYFFGLEDYSEYIICSCDKNYQNFEKHYDITAQVKHDACIYNGVFYNWNLVEDTLYAYDLRTKERRILIDGSSKNYGLVNIISITDGWIFSSNSVSNKDNIIGYCIQTGKIIERSSPILCVGAVGADGLLYGYLCEDNNILASYDPVNDKLTNIEGINTQNEYMGIMVDSNGDIWVRDYHQDGQNYTLRKVHAARSLNSVQKRTNLNRIVNGWYYYHYESDVSNQKKLARMNLSTGEAQYCKDIVVDIYNYEVLPYYWGYTHK